LTDYALGFNLKLKSKYAKMPPAAVAPSIVVNPRLQGLICLRCSKRYLLSDRHTGCKECRLNGHFVSLKANYAPQSFDAAANETFKNLPFQQFLSLNEGNTPLIDQPELASLLKIAGVRIKDESRNPTGSHKDRMSAYGISHALLAKAHTVVLASSGNAAISAAAYAQAANLHCEIATYNQLPSAYALAIDEFGAQRFGFEDNASRWRFVAQRAAAPGYFALTNYHLPALGSAPLSIEGYKNIAYECFADGFVPDHIMVPTARGDLAWGIYAGFEDLRRSNKIFSLPKIWIVEPFARLQNVQNGRPLHGNYPGTTAQFSTAGATVTYLQWQVVQETKGSAVVINDEQSLHARQTLRRCGFDPELCAAAALAAAQTLCEQGRITSNEQVLLLMTANASRDPSVNKVTNVSNF
jgi:threonine synthase